MNLQLQDSLFSQLPMSMSLTLHLFPPSIKVCTSRITCNIWCSIWGSWILYRHWSWPHFNQVIFLWWLWLVWGLNICTLLLAVCWLGWYTFAFLMSALSNSSSWLQCITMYTSWWLFRWLGPWMFHILGPHEDKCEDAPFLFLSLCLPGTPGALGRNINYSSWFIRCHYIRADTPGSETPWCSQTFPSHAETLCRHTTMD